MLNSTSNTQNLKYLQLDEKPFLLQSGEIVSDVTIAYQTFGALNSDRSNAVLIAHALTGDTACDEWWSGLIGEGKLINAKDHFIICANTLGSCYGSTGPESIDPTTGTRYGKTFPTITIRDIARTQFALLRSLNITTLYLAIGGSMGGMILLELALLNKEAGSPITIEHLIPIATGAMHSAWRIAFSSTIRRTIERIAELSTTDGLAEGLRIARQFAMISYRSSEEFNKRFGREKTKSSNLFEIESYLEHQGDKIVERFSPYSYITLTRAMELFDVTEGRIGSLLKILSTIDSKSLLIGISSDILYTEDEIESIAMLIPNCEYETLLSPYGHDSFLVADSDLARLVQGFLQSSPSRSIAKNIEEVAYA